MLGRLNFVEKRDVLKLVSEKRVKIINLCHVPEDSHLKTLSFAVANEERVAQILEFGERVDGSSLFSSINPYESDVYIMPKIDSAFLNPFNPIPTLNIMCKYLNKNGNPLDIAPETILAKAEEKLHTSAGLTLKALAELEFYIISKQESAAEASLFPSGSEAHYQESSPFSKFEGIRNEILVTLDMIGIATKYGHAEVGRIRGKNGTVMEQHEIELTPQNLTDMAETVPVSKWVIRNVCAKYCASASFSPKIALSHAGNGMHIHLCALRNNENVIAKPDGSLSQEAKEMIGGLLKFAPSLTAFGNPTPVSYLRLSSQKETPMHICWGARNRQALIRVPLWWNFKAKKDIDVCKRTFEFRCPDPTANAHYLLAAIAVAIEQGLRNPKESLETAEKLHTGNMDKPSKRFKLLPESCSQSAVNLKKDREYYETAGVFPKATIDSVIKRLESYNDEALLGKLKHEPKKLDELMQKYLHFG